MGCLKNIFLFIGLLMVIGFFKGCIAVFDSSTPTSTPVHVEQTIQQQSSVPNTKPQEVSKSDANPYSQAECVQIYKTQITPLFIKKFTPQIETQINRYYNNCGQLAPRDKYSVLHVIYSENAIDLYNKNDFENAVKYYHKALDANLKSSDKLNIEFDYMYIGDCYFNTWQMDKAKKYYELALPIVPKGPYIYEKLGDTCYNLQQYDEAKEYYKKGLDHVLKLYQDPKMTNTPERRQKLADYEQKFRSILDGTFD